MAKGKKQGKGGSGGGGNDDAQHDQVLQAVLLADSFTRSFRPLSLDQPKMLSPLNNVVMIDYAIEFLVASGAKEVYVVCLNDAVEAHIMQNSWAKNTTIDITILKDSSIANAGEALRELDKRNWIQSDPFILMFGDTVSNVEIRPALEEHKLRHKKDSSAIMTRLLKKVGASSDTSYSMLRPAVEDLIVGIDPTHENRILVYDDHATSTSTRIPCSFFASHPQIELHSDYLDCGIDICSPDVLARFSDEFDYRYIRRQFVVNSVAEEEEGLQNKIFAHLLKPHEYAARVHDFASYAAISQDLLQRWAYPVVPDNMPLGYERNYSYTVQRHSLYREMKHKSKLGWTTILQGPSMVGQSCEIGDECQIKGTVIGNNCRIDSKVQLRDSFLWNDVTIGEGAIVLQSVLADGCVVRAGAVVPKGCIVGKGCIIGTGVKLQEFTRVTLMSEVDDYDDENHFSDDDDEEDDDVVANVTPDEENTSNSDPAVVGTDGLGKKWLPPPNDSEDSDDEEEDELSPTEVIRSQSIGFDFAQFYKDRMKNQEEDDDSFSDAGDQVDDFDGFDGDGNVTFGDGDTTDNTFLIAGRQRGVDVIKELKTICMEHEETSPVENLMIELNSFKFSQNATYTDCTTATMLAILDRMNITPDMSSGKLVSGLKSRLNHWGPLLRKMSIGQDEEKGMILTIERAATSEGPMGETLTKPPAFRFLLQTLHDEEIVNEEAILAWAEERRNGEVDTGIGKLFRQQPTQDFLEWLEEESDEDSDEDSEDDED